MPNRPSLFDDPDMTYRATMLPIASYRNPDSSERLGLALPSMVTEPIDALYRLAQNSVFPDGRLGIPNPQNAENKNDALTGLLSLYGGNAMNPAAAIPKGSLASGALKTTERQPFYHGSPHQFDNFDLGEVAARRGDTNNGFAGISVTPNENMARDYGENVKRMYADVSNPFVWDIEDLPGTVEKAKAIYPDLDLRRGGDFPVDGRWEFSQALKNAGHDALDVQTKNGLMERTVFDPSKLTLFSDTGKPSLLGAAISQDEGQSETANDLQGGLFAQNDQSPGDHLKSYFDRPANPVPSTDPGLNYKTVITPEIQQQLHTTAKPHVEFLIQQLMKEHPEWPRQTLTSRAWRMYQAHPSDDYLQLKEKLVPRIPY